MTATLARDITVIGDPVSATVTSSFFSDSIIGDARASDSTDFITCMTTAFNQGYSIPYFYVLPGTTGLGCCTDMSGCDGSHFQSTCMPRESGLGGPYNGVACTWDINKPACLTYSFSDPDVTFLTCGASDTGTVMTYLWPTQWSLAQTKIVNSLLSEMTATTSATTAKESQPFSATSSSIQPGSTVVSPISATAAPISARTNDTNTDSQTVIGAAVGASIASLICIVVVVAVFRRPLSRLWWSGRIAIPAFLKPKPRVEIDSEKEAIERTRVHELPSPEDERQELDGTSAEIPSNRI